MRDLGYFSTALQSSLRQAGMAQTSRQRSLSRIDVKLKTHVFETTMTDLYMANKQSLKHESVLLQEQKRLEESLGRARVREIEDAMVSAAAVPWCGAVGWRAMDPFAAHRIIGILPDASQGSLP
jgi:hypothetical protein